MSWATFQTNMSRYMSNPDRISSTDEVARKLAREYTRAIRTGGDTVSLASVKPVEGLIMRLKAEAMVQLFSAAFRVGASSAGAFDLVEQLGLGVTAFWSGAVLNEFPIPVLPAPGSTANIVVVANTVVNPGTWKSVIPLTPSTSPDVFIQSFISAARLHLQTVSGTIITTSLYPPVGTPAPGVLPWQGYIVPA